MNRRRAGKTLCLAATLTIFTATLRCAPQESGQRLRAGSAKNMNVVVVTLDTARADRLGAYGYARAETPTMDRLAAEGVLYSNAFSPVPMTLPAHCSLFTGRIPPRHGVRHNGQFHLEDDETTLAERLLETGYDTAAFVSAFVLDDRYGIAQGFQLYDDDVSPSETGGEAERSAEAVTDAAMTWLRSRNDSSPPVPFFLWVHYYDPHVDYRPPDPYASRFSDNLYDGEIAYVDAQLGRLIEALDDNSTLLIVAGDHGESLGEHGESTHSRSLYDATQRVPLFVWAPSIVGPSRSTDLVSVTDVYPTILELVGLDNRGQKLDGWSLIEPAPATRLLYFETLATYLDSGWAPLHALRSSRYKYVLAPRPEFYDIESDPAELTNLYEQTSRAVGPLAELRKELSRRTMEFEPLERVAATIDVPDPEALARLQSLGYLSGSGPAADSEELLDPKDGLVIQRQLLEAERLRRTQELDEALILAEKAQATAPGDLQVLQMLGILNAQLGRSTEAEHNFREYLRRKSNPNVALLLFKLLVNTGREDEASTLMRQFRAEHSEHGGLLIALGDFHSDAGRFGDAVEAYREAKRVDPSRSGRLADQRIAEARRLSSAK